jgi:hypothetical protein
MNEQIVEILDRIRELEGRLEQEFEKSRAAYTCRLRGKIAEFRQDVIEQHRRLRQSLPQYFRTASFVNILAGPVIYSMIVPLALLDAWATLYQHICFRAYGIPRVARKTFIVVDRQHLAYLNFIEKLNCIYCGYGNGVIAYAREIASRTEQYWCPVKHALRIRDPHQRYLKFLEYGDAEGYRVKLEDYREELQKPE